jgi:hypothetical protein
MLTVAMIKLSAANNIEIDVRMSPIETGALRLITVAA